MARRVAHPAVTPPPAAFPPPTLTLGLCSIRALGRSPMSQLMIQSFRPMDDAMVANGVVGQSDVSDAQRAFEDPSFLYRGGLVVAGWGRKPPA